MKKSTIWEGIKDTATAFMATVIFIVLVASVTIIAIKIYLSTPEGRTKILKAIEEKGGKE